MRKIIFHAPSKWITNKTVEVCRDERVNISNIDQYVKDNNLVNMVDFSRELYYLIKQFDKNNWECYITYLTSIDIENMTFREVYSTKTGEVEEFNKDKLNNEIDVIFVKIVGSVYDNVKVLTEYLTKIKTEFRGTVINSPEAMINGMNKRYLEGIIKDSENTIETFFYDNSLTMQEINKSFSDKVSYIIKPINGELSTNLLQLNEVTEEFLRRTESEVEGWIIQPYIKEIWNGEYQLFFIGEEYIRANKKAYSHDDDESESIVPKQQSRSISTYLAEQEEIDCAIQFKEKFEKLYNTKLFIWRFDYLKDKNNKVRMLELEVVNPGLFIRYLKLDERNLVMDKIYKYILNYVNKEKK